MKTPPATTAANEITKETNGAATYLRISNNNLKQPATVRFIFSAVITIQHLHFAKVPA